MHRLDMIDIIFITHLHGDHLYGLFGLLASMALFHKSDDPTTRVVELVGPRGIASLIDHVNRETDVRLTYTLRIHELVCTRHCRDA